MSNNKLNSEKQNRITNQKINDQISSEIQRVVDTVLKEYDLDAMVQQKVNDLDKIVKNKITCSIIPLLMENLEKK